MEEERLARRLEMGLDIGPRPDCKEGSGSAVGEVQPLVAGLETAVVLVSAKTR